MREFCNTPEEMSDEDLLADLESRREDARRDDMPFQDECQKAAQRYEESKGRAEQCLALETRMVTLLEAILTELRKTDNSRNTLNGWLNR